MADNATLTLYDVRMKPTSMSINVDEMSGLNMDTVEANVLTLETALSGIAQSTQSRVSLTKTNTGIGVSGGQRGAKAIVRWFAPLENEGEGANGSNEIGCVDPSAFTAVGDKLLLQGASYDAIKTAFDAVARTENGHPVSVYEIEFVNRNIN